MRTYLAGNDERGFTLIEVIVALVLLSIVLLGLAASTGTLAVGVSDTTAGTEALQLVESRLALIHLTPQYDSLETWYEGFESDVEDSGYSRQTEIVHWGGPGDAMNHKVITVTVAGGALRTPVSRTTVVAAP